MNNYLLHHAYRKALRELVGYENIACVTYGIAIGEDTERAPLNASAIMPISLLNSAD